VIVDTKYIIRQAGRADREFQTSRDAVEHLVSNPGHAKLFYDGELVMMKGIPPRAAERGEDFYREAADA
jgi:hypothetical protein